MGNKHSESYRYDIVDLSKTSHSRSNPNDIITFQRDFWENILGFKPEKEFETLESSNICHKCGSKDTKILKSPAWTGKYYCNSCNYYNYEIFSDPMGGNFTTSIALDKKDSTMEAP